MKYFKPKNPPHDYISILDEATSQNNGKCTGPIGHTGSHHNAEGVNGHKSKPSSYN